MIQNICRFWYDPKNWIENHKQKIIDEIIEKLIEQDKKNREIINEQIEQDKLIKEKKNDLIIICRYY